MRTTVIVLLGLAACAGAAPLTSYRGRHLAEPTCSFDCDTNCAECTSKVAFTDTDGVEKLKVTIDVSGCKGQPLSWMCCRGAGSDSSGHTDLDCTLQEGSPCGGVIEQDKDKCNTVTSSTYVVPSTATSLTVQIHDGKQDGTIDCTIDGNCCAGGNQGSACGDSGVCNREIELSTCPGGGGGGCTHDDECTEPEGPCYHYKCDTNTGHCYKAPKAPGTECRAKNGECDVAEKCDGTSLECPDDGVAAEGTVCRQAAGVCDAEEKCDGKVKTCPADAKKPSTESCRAAKDKCDEEEFCTGSSNDCPADIYRDKAKGFKCGRDCYFCGVKDQHELVQGNTWYLGSCNMGACATFNIAPDSSCTGPIPLICPNGKGLSNTAHARCDPYTGDWSECVKNDGPFSGPVSPPW